MSLRRGFYARRGNAFGQGKGKGVKKAGAKRVAPMSAKKPTAAAPSTGGSTPLPRSNNKKRAAMAARRGGKAGRGLAKRLTKRGK